MLEYREETESTYYTGPMEAGLRIATDSNYGKPPWLEDTGNSEILCVTDSHHYGYADTLEDAYRYYLGAVFGPMDEHYDEEYLTRLVNDLTD